MLKKPLSGKWIGKNRQTEVFTVTGTNVKFKDRAIIKLLERNIENDKGFGSQLSCPITWCQWHL